MASPYVLALREKIGSQLIIAPSVTTLLFDEADRLLVLRHREGGTWVAPGGMIEPGERPADAALRELWEETGWEADLEALVGVYGGPEFLLRYANGDEITYVMSVFSATPLRQTRKPVSDEALEIRFVTHRELASLDLSPWSRVVLPRAWEDRMSPGFEPPTWTPPALDPPPA